MQSLLKKILGSIHGGFIFFLRSFFDPKLYRDVAYRRDGFGLKPLLLFSAIMLIPSIVLFYNTTLKVAHESWVEPLSSLPVLNITNHKLYKTNQHPLVEKKINHQYFSWLPKNKSPSDIQALNLKTQFLLGADSIWVKIPKLNYFGFLIFNHINYLPIINWNAIKPPIYGESIVKTTMSNLGMFVYFSSIFVLITNSLFLVFFIRSFGFIASKMVLMVLHDTLDYKTACRLLSLSAIPAMTILCLIYHLIGTPVYFKFIVILVYMSYFYISIRFIKAKSEFRWIDQIYK
jgi:hypothetical protein